MTSGLPPQIKRRNLIRQSGGILSRGRILPHHLRAIGMAPVVALFEERHEQGIPETVVLGQSITRNSDDHRVLRDIDAQSAMEPVPPRKYSAEIRVVLPLDLRVVNAVHARGDEHLIEQAFKTERESDVAVVKEHLKLKNYLINGKCRCRRANESYLQDAENDREHDLTEMEAEGGGNIQVRVDMMDIVKAPEKWHPVVSQVPIVEREVHQQKTQHEGNRGRERNQMNKSDRLARRPAQGSVHRRLEQTHCRKEGGCRNCEIHQEPCDERSRGFPKWEKPLCYEQQPANRKNDERSWKIFHLRMVYTSAPPQEEPEPAVQPKQWLSTAIGRPSSCAGSRSQRKGGTSFFHCIPSCWLKSQS
jgi:hypothetical protein